jgi:hypothetical protein
MHLMEIASLLPVEFFIPRPSDPNIIGSKLPFPIAACILSMDERAQISA